MKTSFRSCRFVFPHKFIAIIVYKAPTFGGKCLPAPSLLSNASDAILCYLSTFLFDQNAADDLRMRE